MGEAYICRGGQFEFKVYGTIKVLANSGATVSCSKNDSDLSYTKVVPEGINFVDFKAELGTWSIISNYKGRITNDELLVDNINEIYEVDLYIPFGSIKVYANIGTEISCINGDKKYNKTLSAGNEFILFEELDFGEWTITSTRNGKSMTEKVVISEEITYEVIHNINTASIRVIGNNGTNVNCRLGEETYTNTIGASGYVDFLNLSFGNWTITSTRAGKNMTSNIELNELDKLYVVTHNINTASIRVLGHNGTNVVCSMGSENFNQTVSNGSYVDFNNLSFGNWNIISTLNGRSMSGNINLQILDHVYQVDHRINTGYIRVLAYQGTSVNCTMGNETYTKIVGIEGFVDFTNLIFGTWTVTSSLNGKTLVNNVTVNILNGKHEISHYISFTYGIAINQDNTDPTAAVTYIHQSVGFTPLSVDLSNGVCNYGSWKDIITNVFGCKPCLVKDGVRTTYLNPDNYAQDINGSPVDIESGNSGDVMVEFKKCWYRYRSEGNTLYFEISEQQQPGFITTAFKSEDGQGRDVDYFYYGAYEGWIDGSNKLRSLSGKRLYKYDGTASYDEYLSYAQNNFNGTIECLCKRMYILGLLMLVTKSRDLEGRIGTGNINGGASNTGQLNDKGLFYGSYYKGSYWQEPVKCFGIENMWGNFLNYISGMMSCKFGVQVKMYAPYANTNGDTSQYITIPIDSDFYYYSTIPVIEKEYENGSIILPLTGQSDYKIGWLNTFKVPNFSEEVYSYSSGSSMYDELIDYHGPFHFSYETGVKNPTTVARYIYAK